MSNRVEIGKVENVEKGQKRSVECGVFCRKEEKGRVLWKRMSNCGMVCVIVCCKHSKKW